MQKVWLTAWQPGLRKVSLTKLLQAQAHLSLRDAKGRVDCFLAGEKIAVEVPTLAAAKQLAMAATKLGAIAIVEEGVREKSNLL